MLSQRQYRDIADPNFRPTDPNFYDSQFCVHDRLGSVRLVVDYNDIDEYVYVANSYTYTPFGSFYDGEAPAETVENPFKFTGQWHDAEINQYYLRARMYDPAMMRFTSRDPVRGKNQEPLTLHKYLYCLNDSVNSRDPSGRLYDRITGAIYGGYAMHAAAIGTAAYGVATGNDDFLYAGIAMEGTIGLGMATGAITGPNPAALKAFVTSYAACSVISAMTPDGVADMAAVWAGDPNPPTTLAGLNVAIAMNLADWMGWETDGLGEYLLEEAEDYWYDWALPDGSDPLF